MTEAAFAKPWAEIVVQSFLLFTRFIPGFFLPCKITHLYDCFFCFVHYKYSAAWMCSRLHFFKVQPFKRLATETKKGALQHTFKCRTFLRSFSISNGGYLSLSVKLNFSFPFHVSTAHFYAVAQWLIALPGSDSYGYFFSM